MLKWKRWLAGLAVVASTTSACGKAAPIPPLTVMVPPVTTTSSAEVEYEASNPDAVAAVAGFLTAEAAADFESGFEFLSAADQDQAGGVGGWVSEHYFLLPEIHGFAVTDDQTVAGIATVDVDLDLRADLDQIIGLTPARAISTWVAVEEPSGWRIRLTESSLIPIYPDDAAAPPAAARWAEAHETCDPSVAQVGQWEGALLGTPDLAGQLCYASGRVEVGAAEPLLDAAESAPFLAAFGPEVGTWARVVEVMRPVRLRAVLAPVGEQWLVIGVLANPD